MSLASVTLLLIMVVLKCNTHLVAAAPLPEYKVGLLYSASGIFAATGTRTLQLLREWEQLVASKPSLGFTVRVIPANINSSASQVFPQGNYLLTQNVSFLVAPEGGLSVIGSQFANMAKVPIVSRVASSTDYKCGAPPYPSASNCRRPNDRSYYFAASVLQPAASQFREYFGLVRIAKARTVAIVYFDDPFHIETCLAGEGYARDNKLSVIYKQMIYANFTASTIRDIVARLKQIQPDVITWCRRLGCRQDIQMFREIDFTPHSLMMVQCTDSAAAVTAGSDGTDALLYVNGVKFWDPNLSGNSYSDDEQSPYASHFPTRSNRTSALVFQDWVLQKTGIPPSFTDASTLAAAYLMEAALFTSILDDPVSLSQQMARVSLRSFFGVIGTDLIGMNSGNPVIITQLDAQSQLQIIAPASAATASFVYPMPTWSERVYVNRYATTGGAKVAIAFSIMCICIFLFGMLTIVRFRSSPLIKALNVPLIMVSFTGAVVTCLGVFTWLEDNNALTCVFRLPTFIFGLTWLLVPMIVQSLLLNQIFHNKALKVVKRTKWEHALYFFGLSFPLWIAGLVLIIAYPMEPFLRLDLDPMRPAMGVTICAVVDAHQAAATGWGVALVMLLLVLLIGWLGLAIRNRDVDHHLFSETKRILLAAFLLVFLLAVVAAVEFGLDDSSLSIMSAKQVIRGVSIPLSVMVAMIVLYGARLWTVVTSNNKITAYGAQDATRIEEGNESVIGGTTTKARQGPSALPPKSLPEPPSRVHKLVKKPTMSPTHSRPSAFAANE